MSKEIPKCNVELIIDLIKKQDVKQEIQIKNLHENLNEKFNCLNSSIDDIKQINHVLLKETSPWRWISRNPKISAIIAGVFFLGILMLLIVFYKEQVESLVKTLISSSGA